MISTTWSLKIVILGEPSVGKTSLRRTYLGENFEESYLSTIGADFSYHKLKLENDQQVNVAIWDIAGQILFKQVNEQYFQGAAGAMLVYDVTNPLSFERIPEWIEKHQQNSGNSTGPIIILGNKTDRLTEEEERESSQQQELLIGMLEEKYPEVSKFISIRTSAKTSHNVENAFSNLIKEIIYWQIRNLDRNIKVPSMEKINEYLPAGYLISVHEMYGPKIIYKTNVLNSNSKITDLEMSSAIKTSTVLDIDKISDIQHSIGIFPWADPKGNFIYIAFSIDSPKVIENKALYILGIVSVRAVSELISGYRNIIDGFFHIGMNDLVHLIRNLEINLLTISIQDLNQHEFIDKISVIIDELKKNVFSFIRTKINL